MSRTLFIAILGLMGGVALQGAVFPQGQDQKSVVTKRIPIQRAFHLDVVVDGQCLPEYSSRGRTYVEAVKGAEYGLRLTNPYPERVAVALSVDGLNTIDARHTAAWNASKWV